ncbi:MAG: YmdB family metallophosphoesterase [Alphaproteobacteria bacterium]|nr:YmdB family metallophosphoesterase [Alphaproteobacteria bacterium]
MNILFCGDVMGRPGRDAIKRHVPELRRDFALDLVVVNAENAAGGNGLTERLCGELYDCGVDVLTTGNHVWDQRELIAYIDRDPRVLRPANFPPGTPGAGWRLHPLHDGRTSLVVNLMGRLFMEALDDPFAGLDAILADHPLGRGPAAILVDMHAEASSEKMAMGHFADGRVSAVFGSHSHVPTADAQIFPGGTAYQSDAGMCGDYDSVIGLQKAPAVRRFVTKMPGERPQVAEGEGTLCGILLVTDDANGLARRVEPVRIGGRLQPYLPRLWTPTAASCDTV